jgi:predicted DNA-binding transcriptional regulator AlpA
VRKKLPEDSPADHASEICHRDSLRLLTQRETARILKKSEAWLERSRWDGTGPPFKKIGRSVRYVEAELFAWTESTPLPTSSKNPTKSAILAMSHVIDLPLLFRDVGNGVD